MVSHINSTEAHNLVREADAKVTVDKPNVEISAGGRREDAAAAAAKSL